MALQTSASRVIWSYARDGALPGSHVLSLALSDADCTHGLLLFAAAFDPKEFGTPSAAPGAFRRLSKADGTWKYTRSLDSESLGKVITLCQQAAEVIHDLQEDAATRYAEERQTTA